MLIKSCASQKAYICIFCRINRIKLKRETITRSLILNVMTEGGWYDELRPIKTAFY